LWDPFDDLHRFQSEIKALFDPRRWWTEWGPGTTEYPPVNVLEIGDDIRVTVELPGTELEDIDLSITGDTLTIRGERKAPDAAPDTAFHRREREFGAFVRSVILPDPVVGEKAEASYVDGLLQITVPKAEEAKPRRIAVRSD
jgi:HSP20 family protein